MTGSNSFVIRLLAEDDASPSLDKVKKSTDRLSGSVKAIKRDFERLENAQDPVLRLTRDYERNLLRVNKALQTNAVSKERAIKLEKQIAAQYQRSVQALKMQGSALGLTSKGGSRYAMIMQQAGYQVGDFAVQTASGTNALIALTQQGTQLLGVFGPMGAVVGAFGAVLGAVLVAMGKAKEKAREAAEGGDQYSESLQDLRDWLLRVEEGERALLKVQAERRLASRKFALEDDVDRLNQLLTKQTSILSELKSIDDSVGPSNVFMYGAIKNSGQLEKQLSKLNKQIFELDSAVEDRQKAVNILEDRIKNDKLTDNEVLGRRRTKVEKNIRAELDKQLANLREQKIALGQSNDEYQITIQYQQILASGWKGTKEQAMEYARVLYGANQEIAQMIKLQAEQEKLERDRKKKAEKIGEVQFGLMNPFEQQISRLQAQKQKELEIIRAAQAEDLANFEYYEGLKEQVKKKYTDKLIALERERIQDTVTKTVGMFGNLAQIAKIYGGEQSKEYKRLMAIYKAFAIADVIMKTQQAVMGALSQLPSAKAYVDAAFAISQGALAIANINAQGKGFRDGGYTGGGGLTDVAGVVHKNEFVFNSDNTNRYRPLFEYIQNTGRVPVNNSLGGGRGGSVNVTVSLKSEMLEATVESVTETKVAPVRQQVGKLSSTVNRQGRILLNDKRMGGRNV